MKDLRLKVGAEIEKGWGPEGLSSFEVGFELATAHINLINADKPAPAADALPHVQQALARAKTAAYAAGHPQALLNTLKTIDSQARDGAVGDALKTLMDFITSLDNEPAAARFFRQPRAVPPPEARRPPGRRGELL